jgi:hypothetical protein
VLSPRMGSNVMAGTFRTQAERAIASVVEAECPLCKVSCASTMASAAALAVVTVTTSVRIA